MMTAKQRSDFEVGNMVKRHNKVNDYKGWKHYDQTSWAEYGDYGSASESSNRGYYQWQHQKC